MSPRHTTAPSASFDTAAMPALTELASPPAKSGLRTNLTARPESACSTSSAWWPVTTMTSLAFEASETSRTASLFSTWSEPRSDGDPHWFTTIQGLKPLALREIQRQLLGADTLLLEYSLGEHRSFLWAVSRTSLKSFCLPPRALIERLAQETYDLLSTSYGEGSRGQVELAARRLGSVLLAPVTELSQVHTLIVVPDGALTRIPFAVLAAGTSASPTTSEGGQPEALQPLVASHQLVSLPSASSLALLRRVTRLSLQSRYSVAVVADPVFGMDDSRIIRRPALAGSRDRAEDPARLAMATRGASLSRLPYSRDEAEEILGVLADVADGLFLLVGHFSIRGGVYGHSSLLVGGLFYAEYRVSGGRLTRV